MSDDLSSTLWKWLVEGIAVTIPLVLTLMILLFVLDFILGMLSPVVGVVDLLWPGSSPPAVVIELSTLASLIGLFVLVGSSQIAPPAPRSRRPSTTEWRRSP